jgi:DNA helicase-2/ATP-dependent DNA helicase PcrA
MAAEIQRIVGGAGTGKTRRILEAMTEVRRRYGLSWDQVGCATFTRIARKEMTERAAAAWEVLPSSLNIYGYFRTLHSICLKQLDLEKDQLLADDQASRKWIADEVGVHLPVSFDEDGEVVYGGVTDAGDEGVSAIALWRLARRTCTPIRCLVEERQRRGEAIVSLATIEHYVSEYERAKRNCKKMDFEDLLSRFAGISHSLDSVLEVPPEGRLPQRVEAWFFDEHQDASALVDRVCRRLAGGDSVRYCLLAADPFQSLYGSFAGGCHKHFGRWPGAETVMPQSYRCPAEILELGERCLREMRFDYWDRGIAPAGHPGRILRAGGAHEAIVEHVAADRSTLILARCSYSLAPYAAMLDDRDIPYAYLGGENKLAPVFRTLWKLQHGESVSRTEWEQAHDELRASLKGVGKLIDSDDRHRWRRELRDELKVIQKLDLERVGCTALLASLITRGQWAQCLKGAVVRHAERWIELAQRHGPDLASDPRIKLGTIHSAKGAEADTVILSSQSSKRVELSRQMFDDRHDEECRVAYVAVTRARQELIVVDDGKRWRMSLPL